MKNLFKQQFIKISTFFSLSMARNLANQLYNEKIDIDKNKNKQLFIDVSLLVQRDAGTGIQRVVRSLWKELDYLTKDTNITLCPIYAKKKQGFFYLKNHKKINISSNDIFLGLDFSPRLIVSNQQQLQKLKQNGVNIYFVLYDLLPILNPEWFTNKSVKNFKKWIKVITIYADGLFPISKVVSHDMINWLNHQGIEDKNIPEMNLLPMAGDFKNTLCSKESTKSKFLLEQQIIQSPFILCVGTIEPRKGHECLLAAMEIVWKETDINLVLVGKKGWKTEKLQQKISMHPFLNKKLFWLQNVDDEYLEKLYYYSEGIIMPSYAEGYGLPLIEALFYNKKILARELPIYKEISEKYINYFSDDTPNIFAKNIIEWLDYSALEIGNIPSLTSWKYSAQQVLNYCLSNK